MTNEIKLQPQTTRAVQGFTFSDVRQALAQRDADHLAELRAYELTVANLREQLAQQAPQVPMTDDEIIGFVEKHLGLVKRKDNTVIDQKTGRFTDDARYLNFARAVEAHHNIKEKP